MNKELKSPLLLDTHILIWLMNGDKKLQSTKFYTWVQSKNPPQLWLSVISVWELGMLEARNKIELPMDCLQWVKNALSNGIELAEFTPEIAVESTRLPHTLHKDPHDHILISTAKLRGLTLVTHDAEIIKYCKSQKIKVLPT